MPEQYMVVPEVWSKTPPRLRHEVVASLRKVACVMSPVQSLKAREQVRAQAGTAIRARAAAVGNLTRQEEELRFV